MMLETKNILCTTFFFVVHLREASGGALPSGVPPGGVAPPDVAALDIFDPSVSIWPLKASEGGHHSACGTGGSSSLADA